MNVAEVLLCGGDLGCTLGVWPCSEPGLLTGLLLGALGPLEPLPMCCLSGLPMPAALGTWALVSRLLLGQSLEVSLCACTGLACHASGHNHQIRLHMYGLQVPRWRSCPQCSDTKGCVCVSALDETTMYWVCPWRRIPSCGLGCSHSILVHSMNRITPVSVHYGSLAIRHDNAGASCEVTTLSTCRRPASPAGLWGLVCPSIWLSKPATWGRWTAAGIWSPQGHKLAGIWAAREQVNSHCCSC